MFKHPTAQKNGSNESSDDVHNIGVVICHYGTEVLIESSNGKTFRCKIKKKHRYQLLVGDTVQWQPETQSNPVFSTNSNEQPLGLIVKVLPRKGAIYKYNQHDQHKGIAANIDQVVIVIAPQPEPQSLLIDSYLCAVEVAKFKVVIVLNKCDLIDTSGACALTNIDALLNCYRQLGYLCLTISAQQSLYTESLRESLHNQNSILLGQSGVGKSTILNHLIPTAQIETASLSASQNKGRHTTTYIHAYSLPNEPKNSHQNSKVIDSPGTHDFLIAIDTIPQLISGFKEIYKWGKQCKFRNCHHILEPNCAVKDALAKGAINHQRYQNYQFLHKRINSA